MSDLIGDRILGRMAEAAGDLMSAARDGDYESAHALLGELDFDLKKLEKRGDERAKGTAGERVGGRAPAAGD